jgi:two-component system, NarL family, nitrate/nitrite response regulator NarL
MVRVFVADDHPLYRRALEETIDADPTLDLVGTAEDGRTAFAEIGRLTPDVAVLDVQTPVWEGPEVARRLTRDKVATRVLFVSELEEGGVVYGALAAGGDGYLSKRSTGEEICEAIRRVAAGQPVLSREASGGVVFQIRQRAAADGPLLSERETDVLRLMAEGCSSREIGERLHLATATVKSHTQTLFRKLGVSDRAAAVAEGMRRSLLE